MDHRHLTTLSARLAAFLAEVLPSLSDHWWQTHVLQELTFQQHSYVDTAGYTRLDLAALLRIADCNWSEIAYAASLPPTARNWLKEAQTIRNRWAHAPVSGIPDDERFRDLDTIERLMQAIGADQPALAEIHAERAALLAQLAGSAKPADQPTATPSQGAFDPGQLVRLKAQSPAPWSPVSWPTPRTATRSATPTPTPCSTSCARTCCPAAASSQAASSALRPTWSPSSTAARPNWSTQAATGHARGLAQDLTMVLNRGVIGTMNARKLFERRQTFRSGLIEMVIWQLPQADAERPLGMKYRLVYIRDRQHIVGYDNERGKGDHKHLAGREEPYTFVNVLNLLDDFSAHVRRLTDD